MGKIAWYKRDPRAALTGMMELSLEERGAYGTVLDLIYDREGNLPDDDRFLAGWCKCDVRVWRRIKRRLLALGKIYVDGGKIRNDRADRGVDEALHRVACAVDAGRSSGRKRSSVSSDLKDLGETPVAPPVATNIEDRSKKEESTPVRGAAAPAPPAKSALWREMKSNIGGKDPGALVTKWLKAYGEGQVFAAHFAAVANTPSDYVEWMTKRLQANGKPYAARARGGKSYHQLVAESLTDDDEPGFEAISGLLGEAEILCPSRANYDA